VRICDLLEYTFHVELSFHIIPSIGSALVDSCLPYLDSVPSIAPVILEGQNVHYPSEMAFVHPSTVAVITDFVRSTVMNDAAAIARRVVQHSGRSVCVYIAILRVACELLVCGGVMTWGGYFGRGDSTSRRGFSSTTQTKSTT